VPSGAGGTGGGAGGSGHPADVTFTKHQLNTEFFSEGINAADLNRDDVPDVISGPYWYPGPTFGEKKAFREPRATPFDVSGDSDCYTIFTADFNQDGWLDILSFRGTGGPEAVWYENPKGALGYWAEHVVFNTVNDESPAFVDMDGDEKPEVVTVSGGFGGWAEPSWASPNAPWSFRKITAQGTWGSYTHGLGTSDVNGDGRPDLILAEGWWEHPAVLSDTPWVEHPAAFWGQQLASESYGGAQMLAYDVDGDGDNDLVTSLQAHGWGLAWFEQQPGTFVEHMIMNTRAEEAQYGVAFAQPHALAIADMDGDGLDDIVTGKRKGAHGVGLGSELEAPAVLYWFKLVRTPNALPRFEPHLIDSEAGVGTQVIVADVNGDHLPDILSAARAGVFVFQSSR
jgi:FG-GAP-like repeat